VATTTNTFPTAGGGAQLPAAARRINHINGFSGVFNPNNLAVLPRQGWTARANPNNGEGSGINGNITQRWSHRMWPNSWYMLDLGAPREFNTIIIDLGTSTGDWPQGYRVYVSNDIAHWNASLAARLPAAGSQANAAPPQSWGTPVAIGRGPENINVGTQNARYVLIQQTGTAGHNWSIHEIYLANFTEVNPLAN
jgi:hypothetical protein